MYATKRDTSDESVLLRRGVDAGVVRDVETALERNELLVVYQPILDLATGTPHSAEALIRRVLPDGGLVPPAEFVPHVERTPLVRELTFLVVADALGSAQHVGEGGPRARRLDQHPVPAPRRSAVRRRPRGDAPHVDPTVAAGHARGRAGRARAPARRSTRTILGRFDALGVRLSLDDAGRAASFAALRVLPLDELKIDVGFVHGLGKSATDAALVRGMIDIGHALGLEVVAEGVETRERLERARRVGLRLRAGLLRREPAARRTSSSTGSRASWPAVA